MRALRLLLASSLVALSLLAAPASATSYSTDQSDLWQKRMRAFEKGELKDARLTSEEIAALMRG